MLSRSRTRPLNGLSAPSGRTKTRSPNAGGAPVVARSAAVVMMCSAETSSFGTRGHHALHAKLSVAQIDPGSQGSSRAMRSALAKEPWNTTGPSSFGTRPSHHQSSRQSRTAPPATVTASASASSESAKTSRSSTHVVTTQRLCAGPRRGRSTYPSARGRCAAIRLWRCAAIRSCRVEAIPADGQA